MTTLMGIINREIHKFQYGWKWYVIGFVLFVVFPYLHYYVLDGLVYNRVIQFTNGTDNLALHTEYEAYCPGDTVKTQMSFCKTREVDSYDISWFMANGELIPVRNEQNVTNFAPVGCYPEDDNGVLNSANHQIPLTISEGVHYSVGHVRHYLPGERPRVQPYKSLPYYVKSAEECGLETTK